MTRIDRRWAPHLGLGSDALSPAPAGIRGCLSGIPLRRHAMRIFGRASLIAALSAVTLPLAGCGMGDDNLPAGSISAPRGGEAKVVEPATGKPVKGKKNQVPQGRFGADR